MNRQCRRICIFSGCACMLPAQICVIALLVIRLQTSILHVACAADLGSPSVVLSVQPGVQISSNASPSDPHSPTLWPIHEGRAPQSASQPPAGASFSFSNLARSGGAPGMPPIVSNHGEWTLEEQLFYLDADDSCQQITCPEPLLVSNHILLMSCASRECKFCRWHGIICSIENLLCLRHLFGLGVVLSSSTIGGCFLCCSVSPGGSPVSHLHVQAARMVC